MWSAQTLVSIAAVIIAAASLLWTIWSQHRNARRDEMNDMREAQAARDADHSRALQAGRDSVQMLRQQHREEMESMRAQHERCEMKLVALQTQMDDLSKRYLAVLEEAVRRGMNPQVVVHSPATTVTPVAAPEGAQGH